MTLEMRSVENLLGTPVSYAYAVKAGPWLFLTGHEAWDWRTGAIDEAVAGPPSYPLFGPRHRSRREADFIFDRMRRVLDGIRQRFRARDPARPVLPEPARCGRLSSRPARRLRGLHPAEHVGRHGPRFRRKLDDIDIADRGRAAGRIRNPQNPPARGRLGADIGLCPGRGLQRVRLRRRADGAQSRDRSRSARDRSGICRLGRHTDPQADRVPDPRKAEAGARSGGLVAGAVGQGADLSRRNRRHAGLPRCLEPALRRHPVRGHGGADQIFRDIGRDHRDQPDRADNRGDAPQGGDRGGHPRHGRVRPLPQGRRIPVPVRTDGDRSRRSVTGSAVSSDFPGLAHAAYSQAETVYDYAEALCRAAGTAMDGLLRAQYFVADIAAFSGIAMAWSSRYGSRPHPFVWVQTPSPMPVPGATLIADFWISTA